MSLRNWSENIRFSSAPIHAPQTVEELQEIVRASRKVRVLGARHSFNDLAAIDGQADGDPETHEPVEESSWAYISLEKLNAPVTFDSSRGTVTCGAGITYGELCQRMHVEGVALHNMASLPHITVAGACATGTHGSGDGNGNLSTAVAGMELVTADGELRSLTLEEDRETFEGAVVALGGLGVVTRITLATEPAYSMQQYVYEDMASVDLYEHFDEVMSSAYSVSLFPDWQDGTCNQVWLKHRTGLREEKRRQIHLRLEPNQLKILFWAKRNYTVRRQREQTYIRLPICPLTDLHRKWAFPVLGTIGFLILA